jgi:chemotaxis protein CheZ
MKPSQQTEAEKLKERAYSRKEVVDIIRSVLSTIDRESEPTARLHNELSTIVTYIENMRSELAQLRSIEISHNHIPAASDELDAVVEETAKATGTIMDACEKIEGIAGGLSSPANGELSNAVTSVYEACGFQDITGQRITKVVKTLKHIESKVVEIISAFGHAGQAAPSVAAITEREKGLLNGPQLRGGGASQEDIDRLLSSFG